MTRKTILILTLAHLFISSGTHASEPLRQPEMFSYNDEGVTQGTIRAAWSTVMVGDSQYESLVFNDKYDSPLIRTRPGGVIKLTLDNQMAEKTALHFHGMQVSPLGHGDNIFKIIEPSESWEFEIELPSDHPPGMYWYHSHFNKGSQRQVNGGIAGAIMVDGMLDPFPELQGLQERFFVLRNFQKTLTGKLASDMATGAPSIRTINGQENPTVAMQPGATQVWHLANIASNQYFRLYFGGMPFRILSRDGNTATTIETVTELLIGPSARVSVLVDGPAVGTHTLDVLKATTGPAGDTYGGQVLATIVSAGDSAPPTVITSTLNSEPDLRNAKIANRRSFVFQDGQDDPNSFFINGLKFDFNRVNTTVKLGDTEEWVLSNPSGELHQFHIHQTDFQVVAVNGKPVPFVGYRDNVDIPTYGSVTVRIPFTNPVILGKYVYHCHILEHEDGGMMSVIQVVKPEDYEKAVTLERVGGIYGNNQMCAYLQNTGQEALEGAGL
jgi:suppressor of ftsI